MQQAKQTYCGQCSDPIPESAVPLKGPVICKWCQAIGENKRGKVYGTSQASDFESSAMLKTICFVVSVVIFLLNLLASGRC